MGYSITMTVHPPPGARPASDLEIDARVRRSEGNGTIGSLWPDVPLARRWSAHRRITDVCAAVLQGQTPATLLDDGDPRAVGIAAFLAGLGPLLGLWIATGTLRVNDRLAQLLNTHLEQGRRRARRFRAVFETVHEAFVARGVTAVALKGLHTGLEYFPEAGVRSANDLDLGVFPDQAGAARDALAAIDLIEVNRGGLPWRTEWVPRHAGPIRSVEMMHEENPWRVDLHVSLDRCIFPGRVAGLGAIDAVMVRPEERLGAGVRVLAQPHLAAFLAFHTGAHFPAVPLLRIVELVYVFRRDSGTGALAWPELLERLDRSGLTPFTYPAFELVDRLVPGTVPARVREAVAAQTTRRLRRVVARWDPGYALHTSDGASAGLFVWSRGPWEMLLDAVGRLWPPGEDGRTLHSLVRAYRRRLGRLFPNGVK